MENLKTSPSPSTLFQSDPAKFAISKITVHDAATSPVLSMVVDSNTSGITIHHPAQDTVDYTQDPEDQRRPRSRLVPSKVGLSSSKEQASLLKVYAREGLRLSFDLTGDLLQDPVQHKAKKARTELGTQTMQTVQEQAAAVVVVTEAGGENLPGNGHLRANPNQPAGGEKPEADDNDANDANDDDDDDDKETGDSFTESGSAASLDHARNVVDSSSMTTLSDHTVTGSTADADACATTPEEEGEKEEEETSSVSLYASTIYFAETRTEQSMHDLCTETAFQQQLMENPGSITVVKAKGSSDDFSEIPKYHTWDWNYHTEERAEQRLQSHKAVFAFLTRSHTTGALHILSMFSLWIKHGSGSGYGSGRFSNARSWRRSNTVDKTNARLPALWGKTPHSTSHNSLPSLHESITESEQEKITPEAAPPPTPNAAIPLANGTEDGPLFRATVAECEQHIRNMKAVTKRILKAAHAALEARKAWSAAEDALVKELDGFKAAETLVQQYFRPLADNLVDQTEEISTQMKDLLIDPLTRFYARDIKTAELHRKNFEEESKEYYSFLSRYMGMKQDNTQKKQEADTKHEKKRRYFESKRSEYWGFLLEMRAGGIKSDELCSYLSEYAEKNCTNLVESGSFVEELQPRVNTVAAANKQRYEQNRARQPAKTYLKSGANSVLTQSMITATSSDVSLDSPKAAYFQRESIEIQREEPTSPGSVYGASQINNSTQSISGIRDLEHQDIDAGQALGRRKEGFLFATSRPNSHTAVLEKPIVNWHKYWCVLSEGQLHEYSHWKKGVAQPHNEPINLRLATVRSCRDQDRRFCFEVITPRFRRVYQATSTEDMNSWINVISNAIQGLLNGTSSRRNLSLEYNNNSYRSLAPPESRGLMAGIGGMARASMETVLSVASLQDRVLPGQGARKRGGSTIEGLNDMGQIILPSGMQPGFEDDSPTDQEQLGLQLLKVLREQHADNHVCVDCGVKNPDWVVINLGILVCIECSGIHRSLGTHISKVRSLTLDTTSYTKDLFEFIRSVGNNVSNQIWEANLVAPSDPSQDPQQLPKNVFRKPCGKDSREYKVSFIKRKYVEKGFVVRPLLPDSTVDITTATEALFKAISSKDIPAALTAFVAGANINSVQKADDLNDAGPFPESKEGPPTSPSSPTSPTSPTSLTSPHLRKKSEDTFSLGEIPDTSSSPILEDNALQLTLKDDAAASDASSQISRSTVGSHLVSKLDRNDDNHGKGSKQAGGLSIRRPSTRPVSSVMVLQTSPLLAALRQGMPFSLDSQYEVYPLAEFLMLNGAASNASMEVKLLNGDAATDTDTIASESSATTVPSEEPSARPAERGGIHPLSSSAVGSRLPVSTTYSGISNITSSGASIKSSKDLQDKHSNRRSVGQIVELRGEDGASAVEYLRNKGVIKGDPTSTSPALNRSTTSSFAGSQYWQGSRLRASSVKDMSLTSLSKPSVTINKLTVSPGLRPSGSVSTVSVSGPIAQFAAPAPAGGAAAAVAAAVAHDSTNRRQHDSRTMSMTGRPFPPSSSTQDISTLFQRRRDSDTGLGSLIPIMKAPSIKERDKEREKEKEKALKATHARNRQSGDFSVFRPLITKSMSQQTDVSSIHSLPITSDYGSRPSAFAEGHIPTINSTAHSNGSSTSVNLHNGTSASMILSSHVAGGNGAASATRTQKVKASFTKSLRLASYFRGSMGKDDKDGSSALPPPPPPSTAALKKIAQTRASMSVTRLGEGAEGATRNGGSEGGKVEDDHDDDDDDGVELSMAELLERQDRRELRRKLQQQQQQQQQQQHHLHRMDSHHGATASVATASTPATALASSFSSTRGPSLSFLSSVASSFSSTSYLSQKPLPSES